MARHKKRLSLRTSAAKKRGPANRPAKSKKRRAADEEQIHRSSLILVCDIVGFSRLDDVLQAKAVRSLRLALSGMGLLGRRYRCLPSGTGDGWLLAFPAARSRMTHLQLLALARKLMDQTKHNGFGLRIGLHLGTFRELKLGRGKSKLLVGSGLNECTRIGNIGDGGHIIVSEKLIRELSPHELAGKDNDFAPPLNKQPIDVFVKHDEVQQVRIYTNGQDPNEPPPLPMRLQTVLAVDNLIDRTLDEMERAFLAAWDKNFGDIADAISNVHDTVLGKWREKLWPRISILVKSHDPRNQDELHSTRYRCFHGQPPSLRQKGLTVYRLHPKPAGPAALAFLKNQVQVVTGLPDYKERRTEYIGAMHLLGIDSDIVEVMSRKARSFIDFSFGLCNEGDDQRHLAPEKARTPDGVICIDLADDLSGYPVDKLTEIATHLQHQYNTLLTCLWKLRST